MQRVRILLFFIVGLIFCLGAVAQVNSVQFGKNRLQFRKFSWQYYQTDHFNVYYYQHGEELAKFVAQCAEKELPQLEERSEHGLQRRANIVLYNSYTDYRQSNIGLDNYILASGGTTKLVNNKMPVYFDADHANLRRQIRRGIADVICRNLLFGDDIGEVAGNQTLLDIPAWLTNGYIAYLGENWNSQLDDELRIAMLSGNYKKFSKFAFDKPELAGHAFWYFMEEKYKKENTAYFLYLIRLYKNLNKASQQISNKSFKGLLSEFMVFEEEKYFNDINRRKAFPKGNLIESFDVGKEVNYFRFNVNPNKKSRSFVVAQYRKGIVRVLLSEDLEYKTLLKYGIRTREAEIHPQYPMMAWDPKGSRIAVVYHEEGRLKLFVYDVVNGIKRNKLDLTDRFDQIQDVKYLLDSRNLLFSAVQKGQSDIFSMNLETGKIEQITNDIYDDLDATHIAFPNKNGIIFSSNRPSPSVRGGDTSMPSANRFNIFMVTDFGDKPELNQITQLSSLKYGNARSPMQYNVNHFTFISDENGIVNRYAGFFTTKRAGLDTLILIGDDILRNPDQSQIDSSLQAQGRSAVDSMAVVSVTEDSAYSFPISNYPGNLLETRIAGDNMQVSEVTRNENEKNLYKLKIDEQSLYKRNISAQPTEFMKKLMRESKLTSVKAADAPKTIEFKTEDEFQTDFPEDSSESGMKQWKQPLQTENQVLATIKKFIYKPRKYSADNGSLGFNSEVLVNRYQAYQYGLGPVRLNSNTPLNGLIRLGTTDLMEDIRITGGLKIGTNLDDNEWLLGYQNFKGRIDWGLTYYRNSIKDILPTSSKPDIYPGFDASCFTNLYQAYISYPFDEAKRIKIATGIRSDRTVFATLNPFTAQLPDEKNLFSVSQVEFVYDNSLNKATNIWDGLRYKIFLDWNRKINDVKFAEGKSMFNIGFDVRYYRPIYRNFIWAGRAAGDFSSGTQKILYYLGGVDGWMMFGNNSKVDANGNPADRFFNSNNPPADDQAYAFQSLAVNLRGHIQNIANGNNAVVINSEFRLPIYSTLVEKVVNNAFLNNLQLVQFVDLGSAWNGKYSSIERPSRTYLNTNGDVAVKVKAGGVGPFVGGYGFGLRSVLLGYFLKFDAGWPMDGFFKGKPVTYFSMGLDF